MSEPMTLEEAERVMDAARLLYHMDGWHRYWPFDNMPSWLAEKYVRPIEAELRLIAATPSSEVTKGAGG